MLERELKISGCAIVVITIIASFAALIHEDISIKLLVIPVLALISYFSCLLGKRVCLKMIVRSEKISNLFFKVIYFVSILFFILLCVLIFVYIAKSTYGQHEYSNDLATELSLAFYYFMSCSCMVVFLIVPYIRALMIVLIQKFQ